MAPEDKATVQRGLAIQESVASAEANAGIRSRKTRDKAISGM